MKNAMDTILEVGASLSIQVLTRDDNRSLHCALIRLLYYCDV